MIGGPGSWQAVAAIAAVASVLGASAMAIVRAATTRDFAKRLELEEIDDRLHELREQMAKVPTHADLASIFDRLARVDVQVAALGAATHGVGEGLKRVEHMVDLLYRQQLSGGRGELS